MRIALFSDLHIDHYKDGARRFSDDLAEHGMAANVDVAVLAGDIADGRISDQYATVFRAVRALARHIIIVTGNHDYYKSDLARSHRTIEVAISGLQTHGIDNIHHLHRSNVDICGRRFHGHTMWYRDSSSNAAFQHHMNDHYYIPSLNDWVYEENEAWEAYFRAHVQPGDVVVTHHLPSMRSVPRQYKTSPTNRFFVCDMEDLVRRHRPALWLHGHTHEPCNYVIDPNQCDGCRAGRPRYKLDPTLKQFVETQDRDGVHKMNDGGAYPDLLGCTKNLYANTLVVCNPKGYPRERTFTSGRYNPVIIDL
jgi:predicted phosphodiesterase